MIHSGQSEASSPARQKGVDGSPITYSRAPHEEAAKDAAVQVALLWLAHKDVGGGCVAHEHAVPRSQGGQVSHGPCLCQQALGPGVAGVLCACMGATRLVDPAVRGARQWSSCGSRSDEQEQHALGMQGMEFGDLSCWVAPTGGMLFVVWEPFQLDTCWSTLQLRQQEQPARCAASSNEQCAPAGLLLLLGAARCARRSSATFWRSANRALSSAVCGSSGLTRVDLLVNASRATKVKRATRLGLSCCAWEPQYNCIPESCLAYCSDRRM